MNWVKGDLVIFSVLIGVVIFSTSIVLVFTVGREEAHTRKLVQLHLRNNQTMSGGAFLFLGGIQGQTELQYSAYIERPDGGRALFSVPAESCIIYEDNGNHVEFTTDKWNGRHSRVRFHIPKNSIARMIDVNIPGGNE